MEPVVADVWTEHETAKKEIFAKVDEALRGVEDTAVIHMRWRGRLSRLQTETAAKLGRSRDDLMDRFAPELDTLKTHCGL